MGRGWPEPELASSKTAVITQQLLQYDGRLAICPPKTAHSSRVIALDHTTVAALRAHHERQRAEACAYGPGYRTSGLVFTNLNGDPMAPTGSPARSRSWAPRPGCRRSGCMTCGMARRRWPK